MSTYYGPVGETQSEIFLEKTFLISGYLTGVGFGAQLILYVACAKILWAKTGKTSRTRRVSTSLLVYITVLCILNTMWTGVSAYGLQATYIDNRNYPAPAPDSPSGPIAFLGVEFSLPFNVVGQIVFTAENLLADALLFWRCYIIWNARSGNVARCLMVFPAFMFLGSLTMGIMFGIETTSPDGLFGSTTASFGIPYFAISLSLNIILTLLIVGRIWHHERSIKVLFGRDHSHSRPYQLLRTMFIESAALLSIFSILLLVTFALGNPINQIWLGTTPAIQMISNYLIILRVANGQQWTTHNATNFGIGKDSLVFSVPNRSRAGETVESGTTAPYELRSVDSVIHGKKEDGADVSVDIVTAVQTLRVKDEESRIGWSSLNSSQG